MRSLLRKSNKLRFLVRTVPNLYRLQIAGVNISDFTNVQKLSKILKHYPGRMSSNDLFKYLLYSQSEIDQEFMAFLLIGKGGYFVELGACNGIIGSNTYFLEKYQGWKGVLAEPIPEWFDEIKKNRTSKVFPYAVHPINGKKLDFIESDQRGLSSLSGYEHADRHGDQRMSGGEDVPGRDYHLTTTTN